MFENYAKELIPVTYRGLQSKIPKRAKKYTNAVLAMRKMERKVDGVFEIEQEGIDKDTLQRRLNKIGHILKAGMLYGGETGRAWMVPNSGKKNKKGKKATTKPKKGKKCTI